MERRTFLASIPSVSLMGCLGKPALRATPSNSESIDVFLIAGQSNAIGQGEKRHSPTPPEKAHEIHSKGLEHLADPVGVRRHQANTGSAWPAFAEEYITRTSNRVAFLQTAKGGAGVTEEARPNSWCPGGIRRQAFVRGDWALTTLNSMGYQPELKGVLWSQGEREAHMIDSGTVTAADYKGGLLHVFRGFRDHFEIPQLPVFIFQTGRYPPDDTVGFETVRAVQEELTATSEHIHMASDIQSGFGPDRMNHNVDNDVHYNQQGLNEMGVMGAKNVASALYWAQSVNSNVSAEGGVTIQESE